MSRSYRRDRYAALVVIAAIAAIVILAWLSQPLHSDIDQPNPQAPQTKNYDGQPISKRVYWGLFTADDTFAQWLMAFFTIAATLVSLKAVILIRDTLDQTKRGTDAAITAASAASQELALGRRPWISITGIELRAPVRIEENTHRAHLSLRIRVKNTGSMPAQRVWPFAKCYDAAFGGYSTDPGMQSLLREAFRGDGLRVGFAVFPDQEEWCWLEIVTDPREVNDGTFARPRVPHVIGFINYYTTHDREPHQTGFNFNIIYIGGKVSVIPDEGDEFPASEFSISKSAMGQFAT